MFWIFNIVKIVGAHTIVMLLVIFSEVKKNLETLIRKTFKWTYVE